MSRCRSRGSPAHAGIDPAHPPLSPLCCGLPRTRGDRPQLEELKKPLLAAPPHTRGSTLCVGMLLLPDSGSPAHAGIDLIQYRQRPAGRRLPRTRGDRPCLRWPRMRTCTAPPHTRGSTHRRVFRAPATGGSPAHAGIDPPRRSRSCSDPRLPRTRGDRPQIWTHS